ncbi:hypothetical protein D3C71_1813680 [compost metagenome]
MDGFDPLLSSPGEAQPLDTTILFVRFFQNIARKNQFAKHAADARLFKPKHLSQIACGNAWACLDLDQGVHGGGRQIGAGKVSTHEAEFAHEPTRGGADIVYGKGSFGHAKIHYGCIMQP